MLSVGIQSGSVDWNRDDGLPDKNKKVELRFTYNNSVHYIQKV